MKQKEVPDPESLFVEAERYEEMGNFKKAFQCLLVAAELEHSGSQVNLGNFYSDGRGTTKNPEEAAHWYRAAYKNGNSTGALNLAIDLRNQGKTRSAVIWFKKAIAMKEGGAYIALAKIYKSRRHGQKVATSLLQQALLLRRAEISDDDKEEAISLLKEMKKLQGK